jgi:2-polyprenyl-3-methyl-5-hydroxy-6-metoxy-1,4-benzoquinol methylase
MSSSILIVPSVTKGNGSGHIVRCLSLARSLGPGAAVYAPEAKAETIWSAAEISLAYAREAAGVKILSRLGEPGEQGGSWDLVVLDRRATAVEELAFWERLGPVIAVDEGGEARERAHYLVDILPRHPAARGGRANLSGIGLLSLPRSRRDPPRSFRRVLVSFGGEDAAGLSLALARRLVYERLVDPSDLTVVSGALRRGAPPAGLDGVTLLGPVQDLKEHLHRYDLVLTQFGLTAFEAAWAGCGVILLNPSKYHRELAREAGFPEIGVLRPDTQALRRLMSSPAEVLAALAPMLPAEPESLADRVGELVPAGPRDCPACSSPDRAALYRDRAKSYFRCAACGALYMTRFGGADSGGAKGAARYGKSYFFEDYKRQYGRTYLEDWPALARMADSRLRLIEREASRSLGRSRGLSILDVGCAYGPFLERSRSRGHEPRGLDVSEDAVAYVRGELGIPAFAGDFLEQDLASPLGGPFDALSMWYVIEHFADLGRALRNAAALVRPGGILALSTPSGEGASAIFARERFFEASPADHYTIWEPSRARALLKAFGFRVARIRITGHHPERLPGLRFLARPEDSASGGASGGADGRPSGRGTVRGAAAFIGTAVSRIAGLGDTFEVYAVREPALIPRAAASGFRGPGRRAADREDEAWGERRGAQHRRGR